MINITKYQRAHQRGDCAPCTVHQKPLIICTLLNKSFFLNDNRSSGYLGGCWFSDCFQTSGGKQNRLGTSIQKTFQRAKDIDCPPKVCSISEAVYQLDSKTFFRIKSNSKPISQSVAYISNSKLYHYGLMLFFTNEWKICRRKPTQVKPARLAFKT